ncbi:MAG: ABC transporter ATP-binding protein [Epsilonproteobacteria bacterium]|nr:ABC transporter ATP-binding protein [Campylobacterota bacterium]
MKDFIKYYAKYYKNYKKQFFFAFIGMVMVSVASSATAYLIKPVLDKIFIEHNERMLYILPFFVILAYFLKGLGSFIESYYMGYIGLDIIRKIRDDLLEHILKLDLEFFYKIHSGELMSRLINDIDRIRNAVSIQLSSLIKETLTAIGLLGVVIYQSPKLAFFALIVIPIVIYPVAILTKKMKKISHKTQEKNSDINAHLSEIFTNIEGIKSYNSEQYELEKFKKHNFDFFKINLKGIINHNLLSPIMQTFSASAAALVIFVGGREVINGDLTVGTFFSFMTALFMLTDPIRRISQIINQFQHAIAAHERILQLKAIQPSITYGNVKLDRINNIKFHNVSLHYGNKQVLKNINFEAHKGEIIGLVGDSGGGKSSVVNLILRFYNPSGGEILLNNINIQDIDLLSIRKNIAVVTQRVYIFNDTIAANIAYAKEIDEERVKEALKKANLLEFVENLEDGIWTKLSENGNNLSGGQRQRIAIARALYLNPSVLILDEATSALDNQSEAKIMQTIHNLSQELIIFVIAHRLNTIQNSDKILVFKHGEIVCNGNQEELMQACNEFRELYHLT